MKPLPEFQGWEKLGEDTGGEFTLRVFLEQHKAYNYKQAAEGWGNDRLAVYQRGEQLRLVWYTVWDDETEAVEFEEAARRAIRNAPGEWTLARAGRDVALTRR
jgi:hypothetical protein